MAIKTLINYSPNFYPGKRKINLIEDIRNYHLISAFALSWGTTEVISNDAATYYPISVSTPVYP